MTPSGTGGGPELLCSQSQEEPEAAKGLLAAASTDKPQSTMERRVVGQTSRFSLDPPSLSQVHGNALVNGRIRAPEHFLGTPGITQREEATNSGHPDPHLTISKLQLASHVQQQCGWGVQASLPLDDLVLSDPGLSLRAKVTEEKEQRA